MKKWKKILIAVLASVLLLGVSGTGAYLLYVHVYQAFNTDNLAGVEWYSEDESEFTISTADELYEFSKLSQYYDFKGQKVKLNADIIIYEGDAKEWSEKAPSRKWNAILNFAGTFDGQGHTISGMYAVGYMESVGMFANTQRGAVIKNFKLVNSYFKNNGDKGTGSILAKGGGTLDTIYSDAIVVSNGWHSGGLVGSFTVSGSNKITNCWFDGVLTMEMEYGRYAGGIIGTINAIGAKNQIEHCLNSGTITTTATSNPCIGGICGVVMSDGSLQLADNLNVGTITTERGIYGIGSVLGRTVGKNSVTVIENTYASSESYYTALGGSEGRMTGSSVRIRNLNLVGYEGYQWTELDFEKYWAVVMDGTPILQSFAETIVDLDGIAKKIDKTWYRETGKEFTLTTAAQLFGFAELSRTVDFKGVTIKLGADIVCNEGKASDWAKEAPINIWKPIGYNGEFGGKTFLGTFDGQGHTISGLYGISKNSMVSFFGETGANSVVKNLKIENSYFEAQISKSSSWGMVAGVVAKSWGTVDSVYSNAILVNSGTVTGGIVGMMRITGKDGGECMVRNCWYDGQIIANGSSGGIIGDIYGCEATIEHCLSTASIETIVASGNIGGLCGIVEIENAKLNLIDSVCVGTFKDASNKSWNVGSAIGRVVLTDNVKNIVAHIDKVYVSKEMSGNAIGNKTGNFTGNDIVRLPKADLIGTNGYFNTGLEYFENGKGYWVAQEDKIPMLKTFAEGKSLATGGLRVDISWYDKNEDVYTIKNAAQLYGLRQLSANTDFKGKTIKLANDVVVNEGNAEEWGTTSPQYAWRPIGYNEEFGGKTFNGTFDGQGYTVSGLYGKTESSMMSFFGEIGTTGIVKRLKITNSYFEAQKSKSSSWGMVGGVVAKSWGIVDTVYSNAILVNNGTVTGGIVGMMRITGNESAPCRVINCWYDGKIQANGSTGGIIGDVYGCEATIEHCLNTGSIEILSASGNIGGLCGIVEIANGKLNITDSFSNGSIADPSAKSWNVGSVLGRAVIMQNVETEANFEHVYASKDVSSKTIGNDTGNFKGVVVQLSKEELSGELSYLKTKLSFYVPKKNDEVKWVVSSGSTPVLKSFAKGQTLDLTNALFADTSWYDEEKDTFDISTASQLFGLAELSKTEDFKDKKIVLKASIDLNTGNASDWKNAAPKYPWTPIENFAGTFDGGMNSIRGIYVKSNDVGLGLFKQISGKVRNLVVENSYIESTLTAGVGATGSVAGTLTGTLDTVKSSAIVVLNGSEYAGGLVGDITAKGGKITNSWFAGSVSGSGSHHGTLLGGVHNTGATAVVKNCLSTGTIDERTNAGGLVGTLWNSAKLDMSESLFAGTFVKIDGVSVSNIGTAIGNARNGVATLTGIYVKDGSGVSTKVGNKGSNTDTGVIVLTDANSKGEAAYINMNVDFYLKDLHTSGKWFARKDANPILTSFADITQAVDLTKVSGTRTYWYQPTEEADTFILYTAADFRGFQQISKTSNFAENGKKDTVKLGADIDLNPGWVASLSSHSSATKWDPIGYWGGATSSKPFAGIFDGNMHSISGVCVRKWSHTLGLFGQVDGAVIKNFELKNSYFFTSPGSGKNGFTGSIVGVLTGTIDTVKCDETVFVTSDATAQYNGGMVGKVTNGTINNCWFAGTVSATAAWAHTGGLIGGLPAATNKCTITNSLFTGKIDFRANSGGLVGSAWTDSKLTIEKSLYVGEFVTVSGASTHNVGTVLGNAKASTTTAKDVYVGIDAKVGSVIGNNASNSTSQIYKLNRLTQLKGEAARTNMNVDFFKKDVNEEGVWYIVTDGYPILTSFVVKE